MLYFTYFRSSPSLPRGRICTKFGLARRPPDIIICAKFFINWFRGFDSERGRSAAAIALPVITNNRIEGEHP